MDYSCGKFGDRSLSRFGYQLFWFDRADRQTDRQTESLSNTQRREWMNT